MKLSLHEVVYIRRVHVRIYSDFLEVLSQHGCTSPKLDLTSSSPAEQPDPSATRQRNHLRARRGRELASPRHPSGALVWWGRAIRP